MAYPFDDKSRQNFLTWFETQFSETKSPWTRELIDNVIDYVAETTALLPSSDEEFIKALTQILPEVTARDIRINLINDNVVKAALIQDDIFNTAIEDIYNYGSDTSDLTGLEVENSAGVKHIIYKEPEPCCFVEDMKNTPWFQETLEDPSSSLEDIDQAISDFFDEEKYRLAEGLAECVYEDLMDDYGYEVESFQHIQEFLKSVIDIQIPFERYEKELMLDNNSEDEPSL